VNPSRRIICDRGWIEVEVEHQPARGRWYWSVRAHHNDEALHRSGWRGPVGHYIGGTSASMHDAAECANAWATAAIEWCVEPIDPTGDYGGGMCPACMAHAHELHAADCRTWSRMARQKVPGALVREVGL
jgi:hypothetical protein